MSRLFKLLKSRKFAVILLTMVIAILVIGSFVPNPNFLAPAEAEKIKNSPVLDWLSKLSPMELSKTWFFYVLFVVLAVSVLACTGDRIRFRHRFPNLGKPLHVLEYLGSRQQAREAVIKRLESTGWQVFVEKNDDDKILGIKGRWGFWGSVAFHASILLMVLGGLFTAAGSFLAGVVVTEGQTVSLAKENLVDIARLPRAGFNQPGLNVRLDTFSPSLSGGIAVKYVAQMTVSDAQGNQVYKDAGINDALSFAGYRFMIENYGFAPWLEIVNNSTGQTVIDSYVNLMGREPFSHDALALPGSDTSLRLAVFPDFQQEGGTITNKSVLPNNPVYKINLVVGSTPGKDVFLPLHKEVNIENYTIRFKDLRYWSSFKVASDPGEKLMFLGLMLGCFGTSIRFLDPRRAVGVEVAAEDGKTVLRLSGYHSYLPELFKESLPTQFANLSGEIKG